MGTDTTNGTVAIATRRRGSVTMQTVESIMARTTEYGDCQEWTGHFGNKCPLVRHNGSMVSIRRVLLGLAGLPIKVGEFAAPACGNFRCVCQDHIVRHTRAQHVRAMAKLSNQSPTRGLKISIARRAHHSKLSIEIARTIRQSEDSNAELATEHGCTRSMVASIRRGQSWKEHGSPFAGLGAR